jgi:hypothetical protein
MLDALRDRCGDQGARLDRVVEIIAEGIGDRFRHHDRAREMNDRVDLVVVDDLV